MYMSAKQLRKNFNQQKVLDEWIEQKKLAHESKMDNYFHEKMYVELKDYINMTKWKAKLAQ